MNEQSTAEEVKPANPWRVTFDRAAAGQDRTVVMKGVRDEKTPDLIRWIMGDPSDCPDCKEALQKP